MHKKAKIHIKKLKRWLEILAFLSLIADTAISILTFVSLKFGEKYTLKILFLVNYILSGIVVASLACFILLGIFLHYDKLLKLVGR